MGASWQAESGKNLTMSVFVRDAVSGADQLPALSVEVALAVYDVVSHHIPNPSVKWPNDIMSGNFKIGGILIENSISPIEIRSVIGIGINVNQTNFTNLPKASSLKGVTGSDFDVDALAEQVVDSLQLKVHQLKADAAGLWTDYEAVLFKKGLPMPFEDQQKRRFMGIITQVMKDGRLEILLEDDTRQLFGIREITMLY